MRGIILVYLASAVYTIVRYVVFAPKNLEHLPVFVMNKGIAMAAALCFAGGFWQQLRKRRGRGGRGGRGGTEADPAIWFRAGVFGAICHIPLSLAILRPQYFGEFFLDASDGGAPRMSFGGELVFLFGGVTAAMIYLLLRPQWTARTRWWLSLGAMATLLTHVLAMGYCRGLNINASHAYLPPMWLLSAAGVLLAVWWLLRSLPGTEEAQD